MANQFFSTILTPTGLPIEHWNGPALNGGLLQTDPLRPVEGTDTLTAPFNFQLEIPEGAADGVYSLWFDTGSNIEIGSLGGPRPHVNPFMTNHALAFPPFTIGPAASPHLIWTLLTDVPSADGSRGTVSSDNAANFQVANRIATQAHHYVIPRLSKATGQEVTYRLEPYLPMVAHGDRYIPNVPNIAFKFPSGTLTVRVIRPDGTVDALGPGTDGPEFLANHAGGIAGGISTGQPVRLRVAFKPTSSILIPVETVTREGEASEIATKGRHDPCVGIRGVPVVEAMVALVLADQKLLHRAQCG